MRLSIVIPCYNEAKYIGQCLESILESTEYPCEVVVVDDGSDDGSNEVIEKYRSKFQKNRIALNVLRHNKSGIYAARSFGYDHATGDVILRLDSDTRVSKHLIQRLMSQFENSGQAVSVLTGFYETKLPTLNRIYLKLFYFELHKQARFGKPVLFGSCMAFKRDLWPEVSKNENKTLGGTDSNLIWEDLLFTYSLPPMASGALAKLATPYPPWPAEPWRSWLINIHDGDTKISLRSANDSFAGVWRYMIRWPRTLWLVRSYTGMALMFLAFPLLLISAPVVMWSAKTKRPR
jgi:glycosyltransferase involved in cell wall biosynthesis